MVEDELRKAAGTEENVDESLAAGPTQQVTYVLERCICQFSEFEIQTLNAFFLRSW